MESHLTRTRFGILYLLAWVPFAALYGLILGMQPSISATDAMWATATTMGSAALLGLGVWWIGRKIRYSSAHRARFVVVHTLLSFMYAALVTGEVALSIRLNAPPGAFERYVQEALAWQLLYGISLYGLIAGISYAMQAARRLRDEEKRAARADALRVDAELRALRTQLNPHFLFNTLHSITALVRIDPVQGEDALEQFAALLRYVLDVNRERSEEVQLEEELSFVRTYLTLERLRLGDRLHVVEDIDPEALECLVLAFSLQPLVENAIRHGIAPRAGEGTLRLSACLEGDQLILEVADDGAGADASQLTGALGLGLSAVRQRLETRWDGRADMTIVTAPRNGFLVRIVIPAVTTPVLRTRTGETPVPVRSRKTTPASAGTAR